MSTKVTTRPNVLLISLDTLRPDHLGCYGYAKNTSPNLDRFAAGAAVFSNCRAQAPWTLPSHMSLFTSMLPSHNGVDNLNKVLPPEFSTLAQILRDEGYRTAALVNNGQMRAHWGFARGFDTWREFEVDKPEGNCVNLTTRVLEWLQDNGDHQPFFLFLHYFDTHDPYEAPPPYRQRLGTTLTGEQARKLCFRHRTPERNLPPELLADLQAAYDAEIAWLDDELGKLLARIPPDTLVVIFSDHGEAFEEHGWTLHGATLYDEEIRVPLIVRRPGFSAGRKVEESVMLLDVAPTILSLCGLPAPVQFQGADLSPLWQGGRYAVAVVLYPLKGIYSLFDGRFELYRLPDEHQPVQDPAAAQALLKPLRAWIESEQYWMIHAVGQEDYEVEVELSEGRFGLFIPVGLDPEQDALESVAEGRALRWQARPGRAGCKSLFLQPEKANASLRVSCRVNGLPAPQALFLGKDGRHPDTLPVMVPADTAAVSPFLERPFTAGKNGLYLLRHCSPTSTARPARVQSPDEQTIRQLRTLGYLP